MLPHSIDCLSQNSETLVLLGKLSIADNRCNRIYSECGLTESVAKTKPYLVGNFQSSRGLHSAVALIYLFASEDLSFSLTQGIHYVTPRKKNCERRPMQP